MDLKHVDPWFVGQRGRTKVGFAYPRMLRGLEALGGVDYMPQLSLDRRHKQHWPPYTKSVRFVKLGDIKKKIRKSNRLNKFM